jgi:hypothetical protein
MDSLLPVKPLMGFPEPVLIGIDGQRLIPGKNFNVIGAAGTMHEVGLIILTIIFGSLSFSREKQFGLDSGYFQECNLSRPVV